MTLRSVCRALRVLVLIALVAALGTPGSSAVTPAQSDVLKATLRNGMRVVIVRNPIAPVVSTDLTYLVGSRDDPADFPGMAHAQEHMMYRGTKNLSTSELGTIATALGGDFNAQTSETLTQYMFTVPASTLGDVLRIEADRMHGVLDSQAQWENERGAIEQEVLRDETTPGRDFFRSVERIAFAGTPYEHEGAGTKASFDRLTGPRIKAFHDRWYAPNNAILVIAGDLDPARTLADVRSRFEGIPRRPLPSHAVAHLRPLARTVSHRLTTLVYPLAAVGYRFPGIQSPDFIASYVLQNVLDAARGPIRQLGDTGEALGGEFVSLPYVPEAQLGFATAALPQNADPVAMTKRLEAITRDIARNGVPRELFESTKRRLITAQELGRNSVSALASDWATTIALDNEPSIAHEQDLIRAVTLADVNRVARKYLDPAHAIVTALTPSAKARGETPQTTESRPEKPLAIQPPVTHLPAWGEDLVRHLNVPPSQLHPQTATLANGITLIVQPETISDSVFVYGRVRTNPALEEPQGKEGVSAVLNNVFPYGTRTMDRLTFQRAQDDIDSTISGGPAFGVQTTPGSFGRAVDLLAQNVLQPRMDDETFAIAHRRALDELMTALNSSATLVNRRAAQKLLPPGDPELREPTPPTMQSITLDDVRNYYAKAMRPDVTTIVVVGNVKFETVRNEMERAFGSWHADGAPPALEVPPIPQNGPGDVVLELPAFSQANVSLEEVVPLARTSPEIFPLRLGNAILGGGSSGPEQSRLWRDLRQNAGLVYSVGSSLATARTRSRFSVDFACLPANEGRITSLIGNEIERMRTQPVGDFELALVKASFVRRTLIGNASLSSIGSRLLDASMNALPLDESTREAERYVAVKPNDIEQAFANYVHPQNFVHVVVRP